MSNSSQQKGRPPASGPMPTRAPSGNPPFPLSYVDRNGHLRPELVDSEARAEAQCWQAAGIKTTQLRRFFGAVRADERRFALQQGKPADSEVQVAMMMLKTKAYYAAARDNKHQRIANFCKNHAGLVKTHQDFLHFLRHFEAVTAYHKYFEKGGE